MDTKILAIRKYSFISLSPQNQPCSANRLVSSKYCPLTPPENLITRRKRRVVLRRGFIVTLKYT
jgi:hypothetical protein